MCQQGTAAPATPVNPYSGGVHKKMGHFYIFPKPHFWPQNDSWGYPEPKYEPGGEGIKETAIVLKGLIQTEVGFRWNTV